MKTIPIFTTTMMASLLATGTAHAELEEAIGQMCSKMKTCSIAEIKKQGLPEEMIGTMTVMFDGMCKTWMIPYANTIGQAGLEDKAEACIDSMVSQSCENLMQSEGQFRSKECVEFEKAADAAGVDLENISQ